MIAWGEMVGILMESISVFLWLISWGYALDWYLDHEHDLYVSEVLTFEEWKEKGKRRK